GTPVGFTASAVRVAMLVVEGGMTAWRGHTSSAWETADNWTASVPSSTSSVFVPLAQPRSPVLVPTLNSNPFIGSIDVEDGAVLALNSHTLNVTQDIDARTTGIIFGGTIHVPAGSNGGIIRGGG